MARTDPLVLALMLGTEVWEQVEDGPDTFVVPDYVTLALRAEAAKLHTLIVGDVPQIDLATTTGQGIAHPLEPLSLMGFLAGITRRIGLVATASTTYNHPYGLARYLSSLDLLSRGRAGWNAVTSVWGQDNFGGQGIADHSARYERADEFLTVAAELWDGWGPGSIEYLGQSRARYRAERVRAADHTGEHFSVRGPLDVPRAPQGRPVVFQAGSSDDGIRLALRYADAVFTAHHHLENMRAFRRRLQAGDRVAPLAVTGVTLRLAATDEQARRKHDAALAGDPALKRAGLERRLGISLEGIADDQPIPPDRLAHPDTVQGYRHFYTNIWESAVRDRLPVRELADIGVHWTVVGSARTAVDELLHRFDEYGTDGYNIMETDAESYDVFFDQVVPELVRRGRFRADYVPGTLRTNLGLQGTH